MSDRADRMLALLREAGAFGVCLSEVAAEDAYCARNAVSTLRISGWAIAALPCRVHKHRGRVLRYWLVEEGPHDSEPTAAGTPTPPGNATPAVGSPNPTHFGGGAVEASLTSASGSRAAALPAAQTPLHLGTDGLGHGAPGDPATGVVSLHETAEVVLSPELFPAPLMRSGHGL